MDPKKDKIVVKYKIIILKDIALILLNIRAFFQISKILNIRYNRQYFLVKLNFMYKFIESIPFNRINAKKYQMI